MLREVLYMVFFAIPFFIAMLAINLMIRIVVFIIDEPEASLLALLLLLLAVVSSYLN